MSKKPVTIYRYPEVERLLRFLLAFSFLWLSFTYLYFGWEPSLLSVVLLLAPLVFVSVLLFLRSRMSRAILDPKAREIHLEVQENLGFDRIEHVQVWKKFAARSVLGLGFRWRLGVTLSKMDEMKFPLADFFSERAAMKHGKLVKDLLKN